MAQSLADIMASIAPSYDPERKVVNDQLTALPGQAATEVAGLDTAKTNAFGEITNAANARGVLYSGAPINEQNKYVGEKYLPARAGVVSGYATRTSALQGQLADIVQRQDQQARGTLQSQQEAEARAQAEAAKLQLEREKMQQQAEIAAMRARSSSSAKAPDPAKGYTLTRDKGGGLQFVGPNNRPVTAAQYASVTGTNIRDLLASSGNKGDTQVIKAIDSGMSFGDLVKKYPYVFGGV